MVFMENSQLYHHGILGMKWGVRRFQNKDGSLPVTEKDIWSKIQKLNKAIIKRKKDYHQ